MDIGKVTALCKLLEVLVFEPGYIDVKQDVSKLHPLIATTFVFCYLWSIGGNISEQYWDAFDTYVRQQVEETGCEAKVSLLF